MKYNTLSYLLLAAFGSLGVFVRFVFMLILRRVGSINVPILLANILGALLIGFLYKRFVVAGNQNVLLWGCIGFCGGLTTFSSFTLDIVLLLQQQKVSVAILYLAFSTVVGIAATYLGMGLAKWI